MMKIVHTIADCNIGGAERMLYTLCKRLKKDRKDFDISIIALYGKGQLEPEFNDIGVKILCLFSLNIHPILRLYRLVQALRRLSPDVIHTHLIAGDRYGQIAGMLTRVPVRISTIHNAYKKWTIMDKLNVGILNLCKTETVAVSSYAANVWFSMGLSRKRNRVIYNCPSISLNSNVLEHQGTKRRKTKVIVCLARLHPIKDHETLIDAAADLYKRNKNFRVELYGADFDGRMRILEKKVEDFGLSGHVSFKDVTNDPASVLNDADIYVTCSLAEGFGISIIEAMNFALPVIASDIPTHGEIIENNKYGLLFSTGDPIDLSEKLLHLLNDSEKWCKYSKQAYIRSKEFTVQKMVTAYESLYDELSSRKK